MHTPTISAGPSQSQVTIQAVYQALVKLVVSGLKTPLALGPNHDFSHLIKQRMDDASFSLGVYMPYNLS